jgi:hypothetical protein
MENKVIVNGKVTNLQEQVCSRCVQDTTVPGISFNKKGECNFCELHDKMTALFPNDDRGEAYLKKTFDAIKKENKHKKSRVSKKEL